MSGTFSMVPHWLLERGASDRAVKLYAVLASFGVFDPSTGEYVNVRPKLRTVSERMNGASDSALHRAMTELERLGALRRVVRRRPDGGQGANGYRVIVGSLMAPPWRAPEPLIEDDPEQQTPPPPVVPPPTTGGTTPPPQVVPLEVDALDPDPEIHIPPPPPSTVPAQRRSSPGGRDLIKQAIREHLAVDWPDVDPADVDAVLCRLEHSSEVRSVRRYVAAATLPDGGGLGDWYLPVRRARLDLLSAQRASMPPCPHGTPGGDQLNGSGAISCPMCRLGPPAAGGDASRPARGGRDTLASSTPIPRILAAYSRALPEGRRESAGQILAIRATVVRLLEAGAPVSSLVDLAQRSARSGVAFDTLVGQLVDAQRQEAQA